MNKYLSWVSYGGKEILYCDFRNLETKDLIDGLRDSLNEIGSMNRNDLLFLFDVTDTFFERESFNVAVEFAKGVKPFRKKSALVGVTGGKKFLLNSILTITQTASQVKSFDDIDDAKKWITL